MPRPDSGSAPASSTAPLEQSSVNGLAVMRRRPQEPLATVVLVHGAMDRASSFGRVMRRLGDMDVVAYDRRGYAGSLPGPDATPPSTVPADALDVHARDLGDVMEWANGGRPVPPRIVVGHSLGGLIALVASAGSTPRAAPDALCVFEAPLPWLDPSTVTSGSRAIDVGRRDGPEAAAESFYRSMVGDATWNRLSEPDRHTRRLEGRALLAELIAARCQRPRIPLPADPATLHVGRGENGPAHLRAAAEKLAVAAGVGCSVLEGASHGAHLQNPDGFARWVRAALGTTGRNVPERESGTP